MTSKVQPGCRLFRASDIWCGPWNSGKSTKSREIHKNTKIPRNSVEILSNTCQYSIFETYFSYWGYLLAVNLQIYLRTSSLKRANNVPKLPGVDYVAKNWALAMMLKALPLVHFWSILLLKEQMMTSARKMLKTLVWSVQNRLIVSEIFLENNQNQPFFTDCFLVKFFPKTPAKSANFSTNLSLKIPQNLTFSSATCQKAWLLWPPWGQKKVTIVERLKQEWMYGLSAKKNCCCWEVAISGGSTVVSAIVAAITP